MKQDFWEESPSLMYPVGTRIAKDDWVFRYCRAEGALSQHRGAGASCIAHEQNTAANAAAGATAIQIVHGTAVANQFQGGYINIWNATVIQQFPIEYNDASDGVNTWLYLKKPLPADVAAGTFTGVHCRWWNYVDAMSDLRSAVCVPLIAVTAGYYFWGVTWGPVICTAHAGAGIGAAANERQVYMWQDGSVGLLSDVAAGCQYVGFLPHDTTTGDDINFILQLFP